MEKSRKDEAAASWTRAKALLLERFNDKPAPADAVAAAAGVTRQAMWKWVFVPAMRVPKIAALTGIPPHRLRPDLPSIFPPPKE